MSQMSPIDTESGVSLPELTTVSDLDDCKEVVESHLTPHVEPSQNLVEQQARYLLLLCNEYPHCDFYILSPDEDKEGKLQINGFGPCYIVNQAEETTEVIDAWVNENQPPDVDIVFSVVALHYYSVMVAHAKQLHHHQQHLAEVVLTDSSEKKQEKAKRRMNKLRRDLPQIDSAGCLDGHIDTVDFSVGEVDAILYNQRQEDDQKA